jgi:hypothetical protein
MAHRLVVKHAVERAVHIITTSEFTRQDVHQTLGVPFEKMTTIYQTPFDKIQNNSAPRHCERQSEAIQYPFGKRCNQPDVAGLPRRASSSQ